MAMKKEAFRSVLIFGGAGFIGSNWAEWLLQNTEAKVHIFDNLSRRGVRHNLRHLEKLAGRSRRLQITVGDIRDAEMVEVVGDQSRAETGRRFGLGVRQRSEMGGRRVEAPMGRPEARNRPALLVDQDRRVSASDRIAQRQNQVPNLVRGAAIAPEKNETDRIGIAEKTLFFRAHRFAGATQDDGTWRLPCRRARLIGQ